MNGFMLVNIYMYVYKFVASTFEKRLEGNEPKRVNNVCRPGGGMMGDLLLDSIILSFQDCMQ